MAYPFTHPPMTPCGHRHYGPCGATNAQSSADVENLTPAQQLQLVRRIAQLPAHQRPLSDLYVIYRKAMETNNVAVIKLMAELCLFSHYSDRLLLLGGLQKNNECLDVLYREEVDFAGNWPGDQPLPEQYRKPVVVLPPPPAPINDDRPKPASAALDMPTTSFSKTECTPVYSETHQGGTTFAELD